MNIPSSLLNTRANLLVDIVMLINILAPFIMLFSFKQARKKNLSAHKRTQLWLLIICFSAVMALEFNIRIEGGALVKGMYAGTTLYKWILGLHVTGAVLTYIIWAYLAWKSFKQFNVGLPGKFSNSHKKIGWFICWGMWFTSISALAVYIFGFVL